ncbi:peritrophin-44-like [Scylla paramamosain]|uniref:peritrophin-44-like n=1 Tax=Scylla paramamosain TaxID=85552 RepID=UPI00308398E1
MLWITSLLLLLSLQAVSATLLDELEDVRVDAAEPSPSPPPDKCDPDCSFANDGDNVENPKNCHQFYVCFDKEAIGPIDCPDGKYFNKNTSDCVTNGPEECTPVCGGPSGSCAYECGGDPYVADRYDCSIYHDCASGTVMHCDQETPFFNGETCQTEEKYCCHCNPYCYKGDIGKKVLDPTDCTKYYVCIEENVIPDLSGHCSNGKFDPFLHECSSSAPCLTLCTNVVKPDGCIDMFTCKKVGNFPACVDRCTPQYYKCGPGDIGSVVGSQSCSGDTVFDPLLGYCVYPSLCSIQELIWY